MYASLMAIAMMTLVIPASDQSFSVPESYFVSEITRIMSPHSFECKLSNYELPSSIRFRVYLPGFDAQDSDEASQKPLEKQLKSAKQIELRNVTFKRYFRISADLWIDGKLFWAAPDSTADEIEKDVHQPISNLSRRSRAPESLKQPTSAAKPEVVSLEQLLDREIDCSILTGDVPLSEALDFLCESVQPRLPLLVQWNDLRTQAFIEKDTPIGVEGFGRLKLRYALNHILRAVAGREPKPGLIAEGGILTLGSQEMLLKHRNTRVYHVSDLLAVPSTGGMYQQGNQSNLGNIVGNYSR